MSDRNDHPSSPQVRVVRAGMQKNIIQKEYKLKVSMLCKLMSTAVNDIIDLESELKKNGSSVVRILLSFKVFMKPNF